MPSSRSAWHNFDIKSSARRSLLALLGSKLSILGVCSICCTAVDNRESSIVYLHSGLWIRLPRRVKITTIYYSQKQRIEATLSCYLTICYFINYSILTTNFLNGNI